MTDRPNLEALLDAVRMHIESAVLPVVRADQRLYFQTLVALNMLKIAQREVASGADMLRSEWDGLNTLLGELRAVPHRDSELTEALRVRYYALCDAIRRGDYDDHPASSRLIDFLEPVITAQLILNNPGLARRIGDELSSGTFAE